MSLAVSVLCPLASPKDACGWVTACMHERICDTHAHAHAHAQTARSIPEYLLISMKVCSRCAGGGQDSGQRSSRVPSNHVRVWGGPKDNHENAGYA